MNLRQILTPADLRRTQTHFSFDVGSIEVEFVGIDGPYNVAARVPGKILASSEKIVFDSADFSLDEDGKLNLKGFRRQTLYHELIHVQQNRRGFFYRLKMWFWRNFKKYEKRPHELEAKRKSAEMVKT